MSLEELAGAVIGQLAVAGAAVIGADVGTVLVGFRDFADKPAGVAGLELDDGGAQVLAEKFRVVQRHIEPLDLAVAPVSHGPGVPVDGLVGQVRHGVASVGGAVGGGVGGMPGRHIAVDAVQLADGHDFLHLLGAHGRKLAEAGHIGQAVVLIDIFGGRLWPKPAS